MYGLANHPLVTFTFPAQQTGCRSGQILQVEVGQDYTLTLCGGEVIGLRGVEPPLRSALGGMFFRTDGALAGSFGGDVLGDKGVSEDALKFLSGLVVGKQLNMVFDGYRIGDRGGRRYAYVYLADKTLVNAEMIRRGFGYAALQGSHPMRDRFIGLEAEARRAKVGLWSS